MGVLVPFLEAASRPSSPPLTVYSRLIPQRTGRLPSPNRLVCAIGSYGGLIVGWRPSTAVVLIWLAYTLVLLVLLLSLCFNDAEL